MSFANCCKQCSCWCLFTISSLVMIFMFSLALNDMSLISGRQALRSHIINTSLPELSCLEICSSWYTQESNGRCCDRYNMELCVEKEECKRKYLLNNQVQVEILGNDKLHEITVAVVCGLILVMVAFRNGKKKMEEKVQPEADEKVMQMMKSMMAELQKDKTEVQIPTFASGQQLGISPQKNMELSTYQDNLSYVSNLMNDSIVCPRLTQYLRNHACEHCERGKSNK